MQAMETKAEAGRASAGGAVYRVGLFLTVLLCLISMSRSPGWGQGVWWAVFVILWVSSHVMWDVGTSRAMQVLGAQGSARTFTLSAMRIKCSCTGKSLGDRGS